MLTETFAAVSQGFGPDGEWATRGSFDMICQGMTGAMVSQGGGPSHDPRLVEWGAADQVGAGRRGHRQPAGTAAQQRCCPYRRWAP